MPAHDVLCLFCGSADVERKAIAGRDNLTWEEEQVIEAQPVEAGPWVCFRGHEFTPVPCPKCGSYEVEGARGVSGMEFERPSVVVECMRCHEEFPPHPSVLL